MDAIGSLGAVPLHRLNGLRVLHLYSDFKTASSSSSSGGSKKSNNIGNINNNDGDTLAELEQPFWLLRSSGHIIQVAIDGPFVEHRHDFVDLSKAIASLPVLAELRLSLKRDNDRTYHFPDALEAWSDLFFAYRSSSICVFDVKLLPIPYTQRRPVIVPGEHDGDGGGDGGSGGQNCEDALVIPQRLNHLPRLKSQVSPQVEPGSKTENTKKILEHCPNLQSLDICNLEPIDCRDDVARNFATCCPLLENVSFGGCTATTTSSVVPYELMSILEEQQVKWFN